MSSNIKYINIRKDISLSFDKISKILPDHEWRRLDQREKIEKCLNERKYRLKALLAP